MLQKINEGLSEATWTRYYALKERFDCGVLSPEEHQELVSINNEIETAHAERLGYVGELAQLRGKSLERMMKDLGMVSPSVR